MQPMRNQARTVVSCRGGVDCSLTDELTAESRGGRMRVSQTSWAFQFHGASAAIRSTAAVRPARR
jgi:hypothetical protein